MARTEIMMVTGIIITAAAILGLSMLHLLAADYIRVCFFGFIRVSITSWIFKSFGWGLIILAVISGISFLCTRNNDSTHNHASSCR